jgi:hypothetical protein
MLPFHHRRRPCALPTTGLRAWSAVVLAAAMVAATGCEPGTPGGGASRGASEPSRERFHFTRSTRALVRLDSSTGQMWLVPYGGEGGWVAIGDEPDPAEYPAENGRYRIYSLETRRRDMSEPTPKVLRIDGETGRTWTIELLDGARWVAIDEPAGADTTPDEEEAPAPAPSPLAGGAAGGAPVTAQDLGVISRDAIAADDPAAADFAQNLIQALEKDGMPPELQAWSARQLGQFPREIAVPPLLEALESEHAVVVVAAIHALKETGDPSTIPMIQRLERHPDPAVRAAVQEVVVEVE